MLDIKTLSIYAEEVRGVGVYGQKNWAIRNSHKKVDSTF